MSILGNILWLVLGGIIMAIMYCIAGLLMCLTIVGIPFGVQMFKIAGFVAFPFGHRMQSTKPSMGCLSLAFNIIWIVLGWWELAIIHCLLGLVLCITIVGIPFGVQHFKIAVGTIMPFGMEIVDDDSQV
ncbi:MAG: YccF domain-containing protein [Paludibacteraceae bacterium]|nr:YccF domain-containing protein [Paludibacteraceae bacterium]